MTQFLKHYSKKSKIFPTQFRLVSSSNNQPHTNRKEPHHMGLDIFLYKITKPNLNTNTIYNENELDISTFSVKDNDTEQIVPQHMIDNLTQIINVTRDYFDNRLLFKEFQKKYPELYPGSVNDYFENAFDEKNDTPRKIRIVTTGSSHTPDQIAYNFKDYDNKDTNGEHPCIRISAKKYDELKDAYMTQQVKQHYAWQSEEVAYQRKGITDEGWELLPNNCAYCFDKSVVKALIEEGLNEDFTNQWVDGETALVAWW